MYPTLTEEMFFWMGATLGSIVGFAIGLLFVWLFCKLKQDYNKDAPIK